MSWKPYPITNDERWRKEYRFLRAGERYRVTRAFVDYEGIEHPVGETWSFVGSSFVPYHDGLSLFVSLDGARTWHLPMEDRDNVVLDHFADYVAPY